MLLKRWKWIADPFHQMWGAPTIFDLDSGAEIGREAIDNDKCATSSEGNIGGLCTQHARG